MDNNSMVWYYGVLLAGERVFENFQEIYYTTITAISYFSTKYWSEL